MSEIDELIKQPGSWLKRGGKKEVVVSSRIRLARNVDGRAFPGWADEQSAQQLWEDLLPVLSSLRECPDPLVLDLPSLTRVERGVLVERHLISRDLAQASPGAGLVFQRDETVAIMVNEEDHLRLQAMNPGLALRAMWRRIDAVDSEIEQRVPFAFSSQLGYLTACPTNLGTGMRASAMLHLPGLVLMNEINSIVRGVNKIGLAVRGLWGEGTDASGNMFQISNQTTLGEREESIIARLEQIVLEIAEHEKDARTRLLQQRENHLRDHVGRAYGILAHAFMLNSRETLDLLSALRLGIDLGIVLNWSKSVLDELFLLIQPGHLQKLAGKNIGSEKRDLARAHLVRERLQLRQ
ncbi:MAG: protein arginine kinase [Kiritimatiellia bacterium]